MPSPPDRFKPREDWTPDEILKHKRSGTAPESDEYRTYVRDVHELAGLEPPDAPASKPVEEQSPADHFQRLRRNR
jgi:hypothetical protein